MSHQQLPHEVNPRDVLALDALLDDDEVLLRDTVRRFVGDQILPDVGEWYERGTFPKEMATEFGKLGLLGMHLEGYGCAGTSATAYGLACLELEAGDSGFRSFVSVQGSPGDVPDLGLRFRGAEAALAAGDGGRRGDRLLRADRADSGSDPSSMRTVARQVEAATGSSTAPRCGSPTARSPTSPSCGRPPTTACVASSSPPTRRASRPGDPPKLSLRASVTSELVMDDVRLPADAVLPGVAEHAGPLSCLNEARFGILFGACGAARACYEAAFDYASSGCSSTSRSRRSSSPSASWSR
jgi:glutaryl-CoA dehydrogenase